MKKLLTVLSVVILACTSCIMQVGNGKTVHCTGPIFNQNYDSLGVFNAVVVNGNSDLHITQAETCGVNVTANEEVFQYLNYRIEDGVLIITTKDHVNIRAEKYDVYVRAPFLTKIGVNGAADVDQNNAYVSDTPLTVTINGAGDLRFNDIKVPELSIAVNGAGDIIASGLDVQTLNVSVNGAGDAKLSGQAQSAYFSVNGAGDIDARGLECENVSVHKAGIASIQLK